jgi:hypothetical protein
MAIISCEMELAGTILAIFRPFRFYSFAPRGSIRQNE